MNKRNKHGWSSLVIRIIFLGAVLPYPAGAAPGEFGWQVGPEAAAPALNTIDGDPSLIRGGHGRFWFVYSDGSCRWHVLSGTTMDDLAEQSVFDTRISFAKPHGDDRYWIIGTWRDPASQRWYATVHVEFHYGAWGHNNGFNHYRRIALAVSQDHGRTWHLQGDIITPPYPTSDDARAYPGSLFYFGDGDQKLYIDTVHGFFYVFYMSAWVNKATGERGPQSILAARAPLARKMAAGSWTKWYAQKWSRPGLGGRESPIAAADSFTVFWDTYLSRCLALVNNGESHLYACPDLGTEQWTDQGQLSAAGSPGGFLWYNWPVDGANLSGRMTVGRTFRLYSAQNHYQGVGTKYALVTLSRLPPGGARSSQARSSAQAAAGK